jgi:hypothetical protein
MFSLATRTRTVILSLLTPQRLSACQLNPPILHISLRALQRALNAGDEIEVAVKGGFVGEFATLEVCGWIADARTLGPEFVAACAGEGAGAC